LKLAATREGHGRCRGGLTTKLHAACDAPGNPLRVVLTLGQRNDTTQAEALSAGFEAETVLADRGFDSDDLVKQIAKAGAAVVIPSRASRTERQNLDQKLHADRNKMERFDGLLKPCHRVATRYRKLDQNDLHILCLALTLIPLLRLSTRPRGEAVGSRVRTPRRFGSCSERSSRGASPRRRRVIRPARLGDRTEAGAGGVSTHRGCRP
jgi:transposase